MNHPKAALAMMPGVETQLFTAAALAELKQIVEIVDLGPGGLLTAPDDVLGDIEVLVGSWGCPRLDAAVLARLPRLKLLSFAAGTVKATVTDDLWARDIAVSSAAEANAIPVAEFTFAAIVMIAKDVLRTRDRHRVVRGAAAVRGIGPSGELGTRGVRVGIVGASRIGRRAIDLLRTIDCEISVSDPYLTSDDAAALGVPLKALDELCAWANIVSLHAPELPETRHMIGATQLGLMRDGTWLLNTARGSLVDTAALEAECVPGRLSAWLDVAEPEPLPVASPLYDLDNVVITPHIAGSLGNELSRMGDSAVGEVARFLSGQPRLHAVAASDLDRIA